jgi:SPX domain protein involved in polyphosphate accumulation
MIRRFNRYELKYVIPVEKAARVMVDLETRIPPDVHGGSRGYGLVSLYHDSPNYDFFWAKVEGLKFRRKVRLRIYPGDDITKVSKGLVEIKQRTNVTVQKRRLVLPLADAEKLCVGQYDLENTKLDPMDMSVAQEVTYLAKSMHLQPAAITAYWRKAYEGDNEHAGLRVTFDTNVSGRMHDLVVNSASPNRLLLPEDWCIMEVKANETIPDWIISLLARHDCQLQKVSKYCAAVAQIKGLKVLPITPGPGVPLAPEASEKRREDDKGTQGQSNG